MTDKSLYRPAAAILRTNRELSADFREQAAQMMEEGIAMYEALVECERATWREGLTTNDLTIAVRRIAKKITDGNSG